MGTGRRTRAAEVMCWRGYCSNHTPGCPPIGEGLSSSFQADRRTPAQVNDPNLS